jgi:hypothetical protein
MARLSSLHLPSGISARWRLVGLESRPTVRCQGADYVRGIPDSSEGSGLSLARGRLPKSPPPLVRRGPGGVLERRSEIGLRRALGATRVQIRAQFLCGAILLALANGAIGIAAGAIATTVYTEGWATVIPPLAWGGGIAAAIGIGALVGLLPAIRAAPNVPQRGPAPYGSSSPVGRSQITRARRSTHHHLDTRIARFSQAWARSGTSDAAA